MARKTASKNASKKAANTNPEEPQAKARKPRKSKAGPVPAPMDFLREKKEGVFVFYPGRDATLASVCKRVSAGKARDADIAVLECAFLVESDKVQNSAYLAPLVAEAVAAMKGAVAA